MLNGQGVAKRNKSSRNYLPTVVSRFVHSAAQSVKQKPSSLKPWSIHQILQLAKCQSDTNWKGFDVTRRHSVSVHQTLPPGSGN